MKKITSLFFLFLLTAGTGFTQIVPTLAITVTGVTNATNCSLCNGSATMNVVGGTGTMHYSWPSGEITQTATALCVGTFTVGAYDSAIPIPGFGIGTVVIGCPTGLSSIVADESISLFPNPAHSELYLQINSALQGKVDFTIINLLGEEVYSEFIESSGSSYKWIDISALPSGYYYLEFMNGTQSIRKKFIKQ